MATAIALGVSATSSAEFTLSDSQRKTVTITAASGNIYPPAKCFYVLEKKYGVSFLPVFTFDYTQSPFNVQGNGTWRITRDATNHPIATALDLD